MALHGVIVYEILPDGCLNGVYSNDWAVGDSDNNKIFNEIARKKIDDASDKNDDKCCGVIGRYDCMYFDQRNSEHSCDLIISDGTNKNRGQLHFEWFEKGTTNRIFEGSGWRTRENQITVSYR